ncbi:hypothetical protein BH20ACT23_BH20ACT23_12310 [soil metagenome]
MLERPLAAVPLTIEGLGFAALLLLGVLPANGAVAPAAAAWPFDLYFDLKQSVAFSSSWPNFGATIVALVLFRSALLALIATLADGREASMPRAFRSALLLGLGGVVLMLPVAGLYFVAVAIRYAPFALVAGGLGLVIGWRLCRRGVGLNTGAVARGGPVPEFSSFLLYAVALIGLGAAVTSLSGRSAALAALLVACAGPLHAMVWLGWRRRATDGVTSSEGRLVATLAFFLFLAFFLASGIDRNLREYDIVPADYEGSLLLLGGVDSTSQTGALADLDPGALGFQREQTELLSYAPDHDRYAAADTRGNLDRISVRVAEQIAATRDEPVILLGHSQASLILDRILDGGRATPDAAAVISPSPSLPPSVDLPRPGEDGEGRVGGDLARAFAGLMDLANLTPYEVDSPASPTNVERVEVSDAGIPRLALWALGDSILLETDWRREGEVNLVVFSDHVGATRNPRALDSARLFLQGEKVASDDASWRSIFVNVFRYAFEPWRPGR